MNTKMDEEIREIIPRGRLIEFPNITSANEDIHIHAKVPPMAYTQNLSHSLMNFHVTNAMYTA